MKLVNRSPFILAILLCSGCYSFRGQVAGEIKSIAIPTFQNETAEFGIAETITAQLIQGFQRDGVLKIKGEDQADAVLLGRVLRVEDQPYTARADQTVEEYRHPRHECLNVRSNGLKTLETIERHVSQ